MTQTQNSPQTTCLGEEETCFPSLKQNRRETISFSGIYSKYVAIIIYCVVSSRDELLRGCLHGGRKILEGGSSLRRMFSVFSLRAKGCAWPKR